MIVDRDSVAMGDDTQSHQRQLQFSPGILLSALIEQVSPEIRSTGWSWVVVVGDETTAVWSVDHGVQLLCPDIPVVPQPAPIKVFFRYFVQIGPAWLFQRLCGGAKADRGELEREYAPIAKATYEQHLRDRESSTSDRLLTQQCIRALEYFGAVIDLHSDVMCRFDAQGQQWILRTDGPVTRVFRGGSWPPLASMRPVKLAERWTVAAVGARCRVKRGEEPLPSFEQREAEELIRRHGTHKGDMEWQTSGGAVFARLHDEQSVRLYQLVAGRNIDDIVALLST
ncbi:hypothetical protein [Pseudarthrobacter sulfonivorans]|uniref:hypothetical protein n=1 Tax=Pseudarthrobacter sulfonivorans TaxID=121292 RepID=UPI002857314F|nr:hypothetical protein [Pseudarthrobacter sulfonivorans]MDR6416984.1 hypothetical protein [Pseudarthrobacter sulfonivorans]